MAVDIGPKIKLEGESGFRKQLNQVNTQVKTLGTEMKAVESAFIGQEKSTEALTAKSKVLTEQIEAQQEKYNLLSKRLEEASKLYGENDERTQKLQQELNKTTAELNKLGHELETTTKELNGEADSADKAGMETKEAGEDAEKSGAGWKALGDTVAAVGAAMAAAAAAAAAAIAEAGKALVSFSVDGAAYADDILTMSSVTGMSAEKLQELQYAAELVDTSVETITGSMKKNLSAMTKVRDGNEAMTEVYKKLGVEVLDANGNLRDDETVYWELINALGQVTDETERDALAMQVLGKSASDLNPLIEAGADTMKALGVQAHNAGYVLDEDALDAFGEFDDQLRKLDVGATAAKNALGTILLPVLTDLAGDGVDLLGQFSRGILDADGDISKMGDVISEVLPQVLDLVMQYIPDILDLTISILGAVGQSILDNLDLIIDSVADLFEQIIEGIVGSGAITKIIESGLTLVTTLSQALLDNLDLILQAGIDTIIALIGGLARQMPELIPTAIAALLTMVDTLTDPANLVNLIDAALQLILALAEGLIKALPQLAAKAPEILENLTKSIIKAAPKLLEAALQLILALAEGLGSFFFKITEKGREIVDSVKAGFQEKVDQAKQWGKDLISNFVDGLKAKWEDLKNGVKNLAGTISSYIGFSEPDEGPLSNFHTFAPDMVDLFIQGLQQGQRRLQAQLAETFDPAGITAGVADVTVGSAGGMAVEIPLNIDGQTLTRVVAQIMWQQNAASVRNYGRA
jgi:hypothetical protein